MSTMHTLTLLFFFAFIKIALFTHSLIDINAQRKEIFRQEALLSVGGNTTLTYKETIVNQCIMKHKFKELDDGMANPRQYNFSKHFFRYKPFIQLSKVYSIIKDMPKGAALHVHDMGIMGADYLLKVTYEPNLYICCKDGVTTLQFAESVQALPKTCSCQWQRIADIRANHKNVTDFDDKLRKLFSIFVNDPASKYPCISDSWQAFNDYFQIVENMITYKPVWEKYIYDALSLMKLHKVMYVEFRSVLPPLYELNGKKLPPMATAESIRRVITKFKNENPDFFGAKLIYSPVRHVDKNQIIQHLALAKELKAKMPEIFAGFDLVGQEDLGGNLINFASELSQAAGELNYFFHAGETNWYGMSTDMNIMDAILLGTKRLGHAFALIKHPVLMREVKERDIAIEVNVISNTVLSLIADVRNHPVSTYIANGLPVVLSSDDPGAWEADPLSMDFYVTFVGAASRQADLSLLKTLAMNSIKYSAMDDNEKEAAFEKFEAQWKKFIDMFHCILH